MALQNQIMRQISWVHMRPSTVLFSSKTPEKLTRKACTIIAPYSCSKDPVVLFSAMDNLNPIFDGLSWLWFVLVQCYSKSRSTLETELSKLFGRNWCLHLWTFALLLFFQCLNCLAFLSVLVHVESLQHLISPQDFPSWYKAQPSVQ